MVATISTLQVYKRLAATEICEDANAALLARDLRQQNLAPPRCCGGKDGIEPPTETSPRQTPQAAEAGEGGGDDSTPNVDDDVVVPPAIAGGGEGEFVHLKVLSVNNLGYLLSYSDLEGGFGESVVEEDLEVTLGQLLTSPDCQFALIAGEEGSGKSVILRRILREFDRISTPSPAQPLCAVFPIYINCAHLISQLLTDASRSASAAAALASKEEMEAVIDPTSLLLRAAVESWHGASTSTSSSSSSSSSSPVCSHLLGELLRDTRHPFVLLLDGLDAVPRDLANELLYGLLGYKDAPNTEVYAQPA
jgi:Cdc6-like AAA superfamily ATPase